MKRFLFYYENYCDRNTHGGTEVATYRVAKSLKESGQAQIYHAYMYPVKNPQENFYTDTVKLLPAPQLFVGALAEFIRKNDIDVIVNEGKFFRHSLLSAAIKQSGRKAKLVFMHHFAPGSEKKKTTFRAALTLLKLNPFNPKYYLRFLFYPLVRMPRTLCWNKKYREVYETSDNVIVLSEGYIKEYAELAGLKDSSKIKAIPNIFELNDSITDENTKSEVQAHKQKRVLILSRMDEIQKRISLALKIWKEIEKDTELSDWHLDIVGEGHNTDIFKRLAKRLKLQNVTFHGWQDAEPFLRKSAILLSTSDYEGLSLAMIEAQSYGCVPIAFASYASLTDVIKDGENGVIVSPPGDIKKFVEKLSELMKNKGEWGRMSINAQAGVEAFSADKIARLWQQI